MGRTSAKERIAKLKKLLKVVYASQELLNKALYLDFKKAAPEVALTELYPVVSEIKHAINNLKKWMKDKGVKAPLAFLTTSSKIRYEPRGQVLIISPWNFPFNLTMGPLVSAVAAGSY